MWAIYSWERQRTQIKHTLNKNFPSAHNLAGLWLCGLGQRPGGLRELALQQEINNNSNSQIHPYMQCMIVCMGVKYNYIHVWVGPFVYTIINCTDLNRPSHSIKIAHGTFLLYLSFEDMHTQWYKLNLNLCMCSRVTCSTQWRKLMSDVHMYRVCV